MPVGYNSLFTMEIQTTILPDNYAMLRHPSIWVPQIRKNTSDCIVIKCLLRVSTTRLCVRCFLTHLPDSLHLS